MCTDGDSKRLTLFLIGFYVQTNCFTLIVWIHNFISVAPVVAALRGRLLRPGFGSPRRDSPLGEPTEGLHYVFFGIEELLVLTKHTAIPIKVKRLINAPILKLMGS